MVEQKRKIFGWYKEELFDVEGITLNPEPSTTKNCFWRITAVLDKRLGIEKDYLMQEMSRRSIDCRPFFNPLSSLPAYAHLEESQKARRRNSKSYAICPYGINLPSALNLNNEKVKYVCDELKEIISRPA